MDLEPNQAASSSNTPAASSSLSAVHSDRTLRSSSRVKTAKDKEIDLSATESTSAEGRITRNRPNTSGATQKRPRESSTGKGKGKETFSDPATLRASKRTRRVTLPPTASALIINEPTRDPKGKKRALPDSVSDDEVTTASSKRNRSISSYSLRSRKDSQPQMPKKTKTAPKSKSPLKGKAMAAPGPSRLEDDEEMMDVDYGVEVHDDDDDPHHDDCDDDLDDDGEGDRHRGENHEDDDEGFAAPPVAAGGASRRSLDESAAMSMFSDFGRIGGYMSQLNARLRTLLTNIKLQADPTTRLIALQELSELLSISTEDTLAGSFQVESFVRELVRILGGSGGQAAQDEADGDDDDDDTNDEDAALAAALSMSAGGALAGDQNLEAQLLACRCLANLMEALPGCGHTLVYHGAIPVLCSKLLEISYIDLAEQTLITIEKISEEYPSAIVREGGLAALLNYLDFFSIAVQRTALQAAANCCRNASLDSFPMIKEVWPIIRNCLGYADQRLVDFASLCVIRVIESYYRSHTDKLESLMDADLIRAVNMLLLPAGGSPLIPPNTFTLLIRGLATAARSSPAITISLLEADIVTTLYQILTGVLPSAFGGQEEQGDAEGGQGLGGGLADMAVMQNLAHRPKEQVEEALTLVSELMPPLPKDGTFDHKGYSEKALHRMVKAKAKADRAAARSSNAVAQLPVAAAAPSTTPSRAQSPSGGAATPAEEEASGVSAPEHALDNPEIPTAPTKEVTVDRAELLRSVPQVVNRFNHLMVPVLVDVYAASVSTPVRIKSLTSLLKAICFLDSEQIKRTLKFVPIASFASSILSSKDHPSLMIGGLQMVELLLSKVAAEYEPSFRREGVLHEIETLAARPLPSKTKEKEKEKEKDQTKDADVAQPVEHPDVHVSIALSGSSSKRLHLVDPEDAYTLRARVIRFKYLSNDVQSEGDSTFATLRQIVERLNREDATEDEQRNVLREMAILFASPHTSVSSFELLQSGLVDGLLDFATSEKRTADLRCRQQLIHEELFPSKVKGLLSSSPPFAVLVKKLQESLTRMESFEVMTVTPGIEDSKRSSPSLLARQIRLRLVAAEGSDTPRGCNNIIVSIHAIATFQALNDYLRPRLSGLLSTIGGSKFSGVLAALAAGRLPGSLSRLQPDLSGPPASDPGPPPPDPAAAAGSSSQADEAKPERRRSLRLSAKASAGSIADQAKNDAGQAAVDALAALPTAGGSSAAQAASDEVPRVELSTEVAASETAVNDDDDHHDDFMDADVDAEVFDEDMENDDSIAEKTVTLSVADDGSKIEAQTPDGTRVTTPNPLKDNSAVTPPASSSSPPKPSYAAALKNKASDWHLEFSMDEHVLPLDMTVYGAIHQHEVRKSAGPPLPLNLIWQGVYTVKYKKVTKSPSAAESRQDAVDSASRARSPGLRLSSLPEEAPHSKILRLLRVLHKVNAQASERDDRRKLPETAFVNNKLTAKLTRQLEEPMIVASSCLPDWAVDLPLHFPFLFPFTTRFAFLQSTSFGYARLILKWQSQQNRAQDSSRRDDTFGFLGRLQRQKVRISRKHILESAFKVFELYGSSSSILEVEYFDEVGTGLGPTLEFYSLVSKEFARRDLKIWRDADSTYPGIYVHHPIGLFPAPLSSADMAKDGGQKLTHVFRIIGQFVAKAMLDSRIIDISFNKIFLKLILGETVPLSIASLRVVDSALANSLTKLQGQTSDKLEDHMDDCPKKRDVVTFVEEKVNVEDMALDFTVPGYDIELRPNGKDVPVTSDNVHEYVHEVIDAIIGHGAELQAKAFREGFSKVFPVTDLQAFSADELIVLFGNAEEDWSNETLGEALKADHGFNAESRAIRDLVGIMADYDSLTRRDFLQFITGSPKLPIGGFRGLSPPLTVVRKPHEAPLSADDYLPSVMTCVNYLKLPEYSSKAVMREKLRTAMREGVGSFHLS